MTVFLWVLAWLVVGFAGWYMNVKWGVTIARRARDYEYERMYTDHMIGWLIAHLLFAPLMFVVSIFVNTCMEITVWRYNNVNEAGKERRQERLRKIVGV